MAVTIKLRRATSTEWNSINPVLRSGEPGYETDTKKLKIGDGSTVWTNLAYLGGDNVVIDFEEIQDNLSNFLIAGSGISFNYDDDNDTLTISSSEVSFVNISNYGNNRLLTSTGTNTGINAESNFTFDGVKIRQSAGDFASDGDSQHIVYVLRRETSSIFGNTAASVVLTTDGNVGSSVNSMRIPHNTTWTFDIKLSAFNISTGDTAWWIFRGGAKCDSTGSINFIGSTITETDSEGSMVSADAHLIITSYDQEVLSIEVTGITGQDIRWSAVANISQVSWGNEYYPVVQSLYANLIP